MPLSIPKTQNQLAKVLAKKTQKLRNALEQALADKTSTLLLQQYENQRDLQGFTTPKEFANNFAQLLTCSLLTATIPRHKGPIATSVPRSQQHPKTLFDVSLGKLLSTSEPLIKQHIQSISNSLSHTNLNTIFPPNSLHPIIHFYELFLQYYDNKLRALRGVYYTPPEVVSYILRTTHQLLIRDFHLPLGLADEATWEAVEKTTNLTRPSNVSAQTTFVQILDPAVGTGIFLIQTIRFIRQTLKQHWRQTKPDANVSALWKEYVGKPNGLLQRLYGFEIMPTSLFIAQIETAFAFLEDEEMAFEIDCPVNIFLTNTLAHNPDEPANIRQIKHNAPLTVIIGNPPYEKEKYGSTAGGWVRTDLLQKYTIPTSNVGLGKYINTIYNLYTYFWCWAQHKIEKHANNLGVISFVTAASYLRGPGFSGMRAQIRATARHIFILDLEGNQRGFRTNDNIFEILTPVAIATVSFKNSQEKDSFYFVVEGSKEEKKNFCAQHNLSNTAWQPIRTGRYDPFLPRLNENYSHFHPMTEVMPLQKPGCQFGRTWPIAETKEVLIRRIKSFVAADNKDVLLKEASNRKINGVYKSLHQPAQKLPPLQEATVEQLTDKIQPYSYRAFNTSWCLADNRVMRRGVPFLWQNHSKKQIYFAGIFKKPNVHGPALIACSHVPDLDFLMSGGKDIIPFFGPNEVVNIDQSLHRLLQKTYEKTIPPENICFYAFAILTHPSYTKTFHRELVHSSPRIPLTNDYRVFSAGAHFGKQLIAIQTAGHRFPETTQELFGQAECLVPQPKPYPENFLYQPKHKTIFIQNQKQYIPFVRNVDQNVWSFSISGFKPIQSWLQYRKKKGSGKRSSPLDEIRPMQWTQQLTNQLLNTIWSVEKSILQYKAMEEWFAMLLKTPHLQYSKSKLPPTGR